MNKNLVSLEAVHTHTRVFLMKNGAKEEVESTEM